MSGTKIAMPQPNSFQSGALSFMSCTSGRESSPLDENEPHQTAEFKTETKKKRFHPLRNLRRMFRRKTRRTSISAESYQPSALGNPEITSTNLEHRSCSTSKLQEENLTQNLIRNNRLNPGLSLSHDSIFTPDRADSGLSSSDLENSSLSITVLTPPSKECPIKSQSSCSETSLLSIGSSEVELSPTRSSKISDLDLGVTAYKLSHSAAKHKMAVKPRRNHGAPRSRRRTMTSKSPLPITIEVSEEGATGRSSSPLEFSILETSEFSPKCDKKPLDTKISWSDMAVGSQVGKMEERANEHDKMEEEVYSKEEEVTTQRLESFFGRFLSRRSDKKKKHFQESNSEENSDEKSPFVKKLSKNVEGKAGVRKSPNRQQGVEPVEIPSSNGYKFEKEKEFFGKKISSSVSPPKNYWPTQATSRSISPPKIIWPESSNNLKSEDLAPTIWDKVSPDVSPTKQLPENALKDWKNPNFVKELSDSVSLYAREKSGKREKNEEDKEENSLKIRRQYSNEIASRKMPVTTENALVVRNKSDSLDSSESGKYFELENASETGDIPNVHSESRSISVKTSNVYPISFETIHDGYENIQIIEQVKQEVKNAAEAQSVIIETKPELSPDPDKSTKLELDFVTKEAEPHTREKELEVIKRLKPAVSEKPKDLKKLEVSESVRINSSEEQKGHEENDSRIVTKVKNTLVERRKSELLLLTETEEKEWKTKIKPLKKQTSFSESSTDKGNTESPQKNFFSNEKETSQEKTEFSPETKICVEEFVVLRKKSVANTSDEQPELMKVFARRSLKVRENEKITEEIQKSRDSDKENENVDSPKDRKKAISVEKEEKKESESVISKEGIRIPTKGMIDEVKISTTPLKLEIGSRKSVFQRYGRSLSENNTKPKEETEFKRDSSVLEENSLNKIRTEKVSNKLEKGEKQKERDEELEKEEETGFKRIQQRKAEWERRAQQGAK